MGDTFVVPIFHHGGQLLQNLLGELEYVNGLVKRFEEMDIDHVNFGDMVKLFESLGYREYRRVFWEDRNAPELETGLNTMRGDAGVRELLDYLRQNLETEFHLYWDHVINDPIIIDNLDEVNPGGANGANVGAAGAGGLGGLGAGAGGVGDLGAGAGSVGDLGSGGDGLVANVGGHSAEPINLNDTSSSSDDGYETTEDEPYIPPTDMGLDSESDDA
ncbi:hypothetical protein PIB30_058291 [Stylosanthes scabra]|uniref:PB1-like domain-containing protein n=1 Tax=Stylosanthes scabra TaxID=79078 RepID=A0ABU6YIR7_9FABA|nr:hypothetical protein [Stylosanthes scabra]